MRLPLGFLASGVAAGIKRSSQPDLALLYAPSPLAWALVTTQNLVKAPFISRNRALYDSDRPVRAVVVNSGNANCATGDEGAHDNEVFAAQAATTLKVAREEVVTASTGIVGERLPVARILARLPSLKQGLAEGAEAAAKAIMTTDTRPKLAEAKLPGGARIVGIAKGSGMI
ncbi:MAG: bifunctional ornithine acetyltransferase/N-acetylglutamate synthase, partial [Deinococcota bacterium]|nr:bifunctional ornithine acetyltransferase/N-acetylglutamate synthase [Deinococcota bacterium]